MDDLRALRRWAITRYHDVVSNRPKENIYRENLRITWQQVIDKIDEMLPDAPHQADPAAGDIKPSSHPDCFYSGGCGCNNIRLDVKPRR